MSGPEVNKNLLMVGDSQTGKTHLFYSYLRGKPPEECFLPLSKSVTHEMNIEGTKLLFGLSPIDGTADDPSSAGTPSVDVIVMCFALDNAGSLQNVSDKWVPKMASHWPGVPIILVGTKMDLRKDKKAKTIPKNKVKEVSQSIGAVAYLECSSNNNEGVTEVFDLAARTALKSQTKRARPVSKASYKSPTSVSEMPESEQNTDQKQKSEHNNNSKADYSKHSDMSNKNEKGKTKDKKKKSGCYIL